MAACYRRVTSDVRMGLWKGYVRGSGLGQCAAKLNIRRGKWLLRSREHDNETMVNRAGRWTAG